MFTGGARGSPRSASAAQTGGGGAGLRGGCSKWEVGRQAGRAVRAAREPGSYLARGSLPPPPFPFPSWVVPTERPDCHCVCAGPHRGGQ